MKPPAEITERGDGDAEYNARLSFASFGSVFYPPALWSFSALLGL